MMEQAVVEYLANALWQVPLLAGGAWLLLWAMRAGPRMQHGVWLAVLGLAVVLPLHGMGGEGESAGQVWQAGAATQMPVVALNEADRAAVREEAQPVGTAWLEVAPKMRSVRLSATAAAWLIRAYVVTVLLGVFRVMWAWRVARSLVEDSCETRLAQREMTALEKYGQRLRVELPRVRESDRVASPMIVGLRAPVLLLPKGFARHTEEELRAALWHELAHVQRRDYLVNLMCQIVALPVGWHPVTYGVQRRIRRTREMVCDAMAAREMRSEIGYARCLLTMARSMMGLQPMTEQAHGLGVGLGLFGNNVLEERVMRLMETKVAMSARVKVARAMSGATAMVAAAAMATMFHVVPTMAESNAQVAPIASGVSTPAPEPAPMPEASPAPTPSPMAQEGQQKAASVYRGKDGRAVATVHGHCRKLTQEQQSRIDKAVAEATAQVNSPDFKQRIADIQKEVAEVNARVNSPEFKRQITEAQEQAMKATDFVNSDAFKKQMEDVKKMTANLKVAEATAYVNSPEFRRQMEELQKSVAEAMQGVK